MGSGFGRLQRVRAKKFAERCSNEKAMIVSLLSCTITDLFFCNFKGCFL
jgi:hypothetical protein